MVQLYCETGFPDGWAYSIEEIARIVDVDRKTAVAVIREEAVKALEHDEPPAPATDKPV